MKRSYKLQSLDCANCASKMETAIGALPGLNSTMAISLLIPITYTMSPYAAFIMMMAVYTSAFYGGSLTSIRIHPPGTPSSAATAADGYALTKKGRGLEAMGMSTVASMIGGALSGVALLTLAPLLGKVTLLFSAPGDFLIVILGLSIIGGLGGDDITAAQIRNAFARLAALAEGDQRTKGAPAAGLQWAEAAAGKASASTPDPVPTGICRAEILSLPQRVADEYPRPGQPGATSSAHSSNRVVFLGVDDEGEVA